MAGTTVRNGFVHLGGRHHESEKSERYKPKAQEMCCDCNLEPGGLHHHRLACRLQVERAFPPLTK